MKPTIYKVEAEGDAIYIVATSRDEAEKQFRAHMGEVPSSLLTWSEVSEIPEGEIAL